MTRPLVTISPLQHRGARRIKVECPFDEVVISKIKQIEGRLWSKTHSCWHVPYTQVAFRQLKDLFNINVPPEYVKPEKNGTALPSALKDSTRPATSRPKKDDMQPQFIDYKNYGKTGRVVTGEKILVKKVNQQWLAVYVPYDKKRWMGAVKGIEGRKWDTENTCWYLPYVKASFYQLKKSTGLENVVFDFEIEKDIPDEYHTPATANRSVKHQKRIGFDLLSEPQKKAVRQTEEQLILKQYSYSTIKNYRNNLIGLFNYHKNIAPNELHPRDVEKYLIHLIRFKKIAESTQNQIINAYKSYVEKVLKRPKEWVDIPRPKRPKKLPDILSPEEVVRLISSPKNIKHKLALLLIYSAGLRRSELLNVLKKDINVNRRVIHIKGGKGKKDRYVALAESVIPYLKLYLKKEKPKRWLFEGQGGGKYSGTSLQKIFEKAVETSKVNAYATLHTLRHSYATHCVENGHSLKSVQEALGHGSLATTEVYLHISTNALRKLPSPLDNLDFK